MVINLSHGPIAVGEKVLISGKETRFIQSIQSLQIESVNVERARKGQQVGLKTHTPAKAGDKVFKTLGP